MRSAQSIAAPARVPEESVVSLEWYRTLTGRAKHAFWASAIGWALDAFDYQVFSFMLTAVAAAFALSQAQAGLIATATLIVSAVGGVLAGMLADQIGRVRTLMVTVAVYSVFTFLSGVSQSYEQLLVFRSLQGLGFGGEWAAGAILVAEIANPAQRGRVLGAIQSAWAVGWGLAAIAYTVVFSLVSPDLGWRILFWLGIIPALLIVYVRSFVQEPEVFVETRQARQSRSEAAVAAGATRNPLAQIFAPDLLPRTLAASLLALGAQGGYYAIFTWLPTFLKTERQLSVVGTGGYTAVVIVGSFIGYIVSGYLNDWLGRRPAFAVYAICSAVLILLYTNIPQGANELLLVLGLPLGFFASGIFSGFGSYLAELFPSRARGAGQGFCYNFGRAAGALFPTGIGFLSAAIGLAGAIGFGAVGYALCLVALLFLPETRGKQLVAVE
jgi:MFS family permease